MSETDKLARMIRYGLFIIAAFGFGTYVLDIGRDDSDGSSRSGMSVHIDAKTGCQYLSTYGGITPRLNGSGKQEGCR